MIYFPYCCYITFYRGNKLPPFYIGYTLTDKYMYAWDTYRGSVSSKKYKNIWKEEIKIHNELFQTRIISFHMTKDEAILREKKFHEALKVHKNPLYVNMKCSCGKYGGRESGFKPDKETLEKMSLNRRGKYLGPRSNEVCKKLSVALMGHEVSQETRIKLSKALKGRPLYHKPKLCDICGKNFKPSVLKRHQIKCKRIYNVSINEDIRS